MNGTVIALSAALILQIGLAAFLSYSQTNFTGSDPTEVLVKVKSNDLDKVTIYDRQQNKTLTVNKPGKDWRWFIPDYYNFPCHDFNVKRLFDRVEGMKRGWTLATTPDAAKLFGCTDDTCMQKITLWRGGKKVALLYIGRSPQPKMVNVRLDGENNIYEVRMEHGVADVTPSEWIDNRYADVKPGNILKVEFNKLVLERDKKRKWVLASEGKTMSLTPEAADNMLERAADFSIREILGDKEKPEFNMGSPTFKWTVTTGDGTNRVYSLSKLTSTNPTDDSYRVLKMSTAPYYFKIDALCESRLRELTWDFMKQQEDIQQKINEAKAKAEAEEEAQKKLETAAPK